MTAHRTGDGPVPDDTADVRWHPIWGARGWAPATRTVATRGWAFDLGADGLSRLSFRGSDVAERIYLGVRDLHWNTVRGRLESLEVSPEGDDLAACSVRFDDGERCLDSTWRVLVHDDGTLDLRVEIRPLRDFVAAKLGLCVLHSQAVAVGARYRATGTSGEATGTLPETIDPQRLADGVLTAMFPPFRSLWLQSGDDRSEVTFDFTGDMYEMQDHRNWADANFKTYSTPQAWGGPWTYTPDAPLVREVRITVHGAEPAAAARSASAAVAPTPRLGPGTGSAFPVSVSISPRSLTPSSSAGRLLRLLAPTRLRIELATELDADAREVLRGTLTELGATIELALLASDDRHARGLLESLGPDAPISRLMVIGVMPDGAVREATEPDGEGRAALGRSITGDHPELTAGTGGFFCQVNRNRPRTGDSRILAFGISPQVHLGESRSIIANLDAIPAMAETARAIYGSDVRLHAGPVRLVPAQGPFHTGHMPRLDGAPMSGDARLAGTFGAAWLVGTVHRLLMARHDSASLLDALGPGGVIVDHDAAVFDLPAGSVVMPAFHVLRTVMAARRLQAVELEDAAGAVAGVVVHGDRQCQLLVASLSEAPLELDVSAISDRHRLRWAMDERTVTSAMVDPWGFGDPDPGFADHPRSPIHLEPFAVLLLDLDPGEASHG